MYWPLPWEVDLRPLMRWLRTMGVEVVLPAFDEESGRYRPASAPADEKLLLPGRQGILEPDPKKWVKSTNIDFWLVPGLAFDWDGNRLGHGGGWFDRLLEGRLGRHACVELPIRGRWLIRYPGNNMTSGGTGPSFLHQRSVQRP